METKKDVSNVMLSRLNLPLIVKCWCRRKVAAVIPPATSSALGSYRADGRVVTEGYYIIKMTGRMMGIIKQKQKKICYLL